MQIRCVLPFFAALVALPSHAQSSPVTLPTGTQLPVSIPGNLPMKLGEPVHAELLYPVYAGDHLVLPAHTQVTGTIVSLADNHSRRVQARLRGDFTPFHIPVVQFNSLRMPNGTEQPIQTGTATDGAPVYRLVAPPPRKGGFFTRQFGDARQFALDRVHILTGPEKKDRLVQFIYSQLPYHPERIVKGTAWTVETSAPVALPADALVASTDRVHVPPTPATSASAQASENPGPPTWILEGYLDTPMSSASSQTGQIIRATVAEPVRNPDGSIAVPQGSVLTGTVTQARPARRLARDGQLRFSFRQLTLPGGQPESVRASLKGADSSSASQLAMDSEGDVKPKPQDKVLVPLLLLALAARPLDRDHGEHQLGKDASGSNSIGLLGFILGTAAQKPILAAGIGYYGAAIAVYNRLFARGKEVAFTRDTRVVIQTTTTRSAALRPISAQP